VLRRLKCVIRHGVYCLNATDQGGPQKSKIIPSYVLYLPLQRVVVIVAASGGAMVKVWCKSALMRYIYTLRQPRVYSAPRQLMNSGGGGPSCELRQSPGEDGHPASEARGQGRTVDG
jgi:hypothetical protein